MLKGLCHYCFLHFLYYANYALPWSRRFFLKFFGFATEGANREAATTSRDDNRFFQTVPGKTNWKFFGFAKEEASREAATTSRDCNRFFQTVPGETNWNFVKVVKIRRNSAVYYGRKGFEFDASKSVGGGRYNDDCFGFHLCSELWTWMLEFDKQDL